MLECYVYYACVMLLMLLNTIKGGSSFLFTIENADFELTTSVILAASGNQLLFKY